ncbi:MAG: phosphatidate cytidylyltransferase [Pirellulaceae bacterium]|jgi:phosphatidate cytidylyltransferase
MFEQLTYTLAPLLLDDPSTTTHMELDYPTRWLLGVVLVLLAVAYAAGWILQNKPDSAINPAVLRTFNLKVRAWWMMCAILVAAVLFGFPTTVMLFGLVSFWALREFVTMTPTRRGDHRALFWVFFVFTPLQYVLIGLDRDTYLDLFPNSNGDFYGLYSIMIPVYASLFIPARIALSGDHKRFLERSAKIQAGLLICVYSLSYAPALLSLELTDSNNDPWVGSSVGLLFFFVIVVQLGDVFQYIWGKFLGRRVIAPTINASRTWEGFFGGVATTTLVGGLLWKVTPFLFWEAMCMSMVIAVMGFAGGMTMSAIKRDRGVKDYGTLVQGHVGVLDRIDSICFAAPVFFHLTRFFFSDFS